MKYWWKGFVALILVLLFVALWRNDYFPEAEAWVNARYETVFGERFQKPVLRDELNKALDAKIGAQKQQSLAEERQIAMQTIATQDFSAYPADHQEYVRIHKAAAQEALSRAKTHDEVAVALANYERRLAIRGLMEKTPEGVYLQREPWLVAFHDGLVREENPIVFAWSGSEEEFRTKVRKIALADEFGGTVKSAQFTGIGNRCEAQITYENPPGSYLKTMVAIRDWVARNIKQEMSDSTKVLLIHDYLVEHVRYTKGQEGKTANGYSVYSPAAAIFDGTGVCNAYASSFYLLAREAGLDCMMVTGTSKEENHAWNMVRVNGQWYQIDVTWDDPVSPYGQSLRHDYYLKSDETFRKDHRWNKENDKGEVYPLCPQNYAG